LWLLLPALAGCFQSYPYVPNRPPVPLLNHAGEISVSGGVHWPDAPGYDLQVAYAVSDHFAAYAGIQSDHGEISPVFPLTFFSGPDHYKNDFYEFGAGYNDLLTNSLRSETYLLYGFGSGAADRGSGWFASDVYSATLKTFRVGVQEVLYSSGKTGDVGGGIIAGYEHISNLITGTQSEIYIDSVGQHHYSATVVPYQPLSDFYAGPLLFFRVGWKNVKIMFETWYVFRTTPTNVTTNSILGSSNESLSLLLDF